MGKHVFAVALVALVAAGCSQPKLERTTRAVAHSVPTKGDGVVAGSIIVRITDVHVSGASAPTTPSSLPAGVTAGDLANLAKLPVAAARFVVQPGRDRSALVGASDEIVSLTNARVMYARRKLNGPADKRPWVRLELQRLDDIAVPRFEALQTGQDAGMLAVVSPQFALDLLNGVLTGSVKDHTLNNGGRSIEFNTSIDKANRELHKTKDERDDRERLLKSLAITGDIFKGVAQLRPDGTLRKLQLMLKERPDKLTNLTLTVDLDMDNGPKQAVALTPPVREQTIRVSNLSALRGNIAQRLTPTAAAQ